MTEQTLEMDDEVDLDTPTEVHLTDPKNGLPWYDDAGDGTDKNPGNPVTVSVLSSESNQIKQKLHTIQQRYRIKAKNNTGPNQGSLTFKQEEEYAAEIYASVMVDWYLTLKNRGPHLDVTFTEKLAIQWCRQNPRFAKQLSSGSDDLQKFASDVEGNFTQKGSPSSTKPSPKK